MITIGQGLAILVQLARMRVHASVLPPDVEQPPERRFHLTPRPLPEIDMYLGLPTHGVLSSHFGMRMHPVAGVMRQHSGVDIAAPGGTPVWATAQGVVTHAGPRGGYGLTVIIDHWDGRQTLYAHLSEISVVAGEQVRARQLIGAVGQTGLATGPHVHYEVRDGGVPVDPGLG